RSPSGRVALGLHAVAVRRLIALIGLLVVVEPVERAGARADATTDEGALARALAAAGDTATQRADGRAAQRTDARVLRGVQDLVVLGPLRSALAGGHAVALGDDRLRRHAAPRDRRRRRRRRGRRGRLGRRRRRGRRL